MKILQKLIREFTLLLANLSFAQQEVQELIDVDLITGSVVDMNGEYVGIGVTGEEMWPFIDGKPYPYPDGVIWNVNDSEVPQVVRDCSLVASQTLASYITNVNDPVYMALSYAKNFGVPTTFFIWTNDYTQGAQWEVDQYRPARSWNWEDSYLKWESTVDNDGTCNIPEKQQVYSMILLEVRKKEGASHQFPAQLVELYNNWNPTPALGGEGQLSIGGF